jgi:predicted lipoprotein
MSRKEVKNVKKTHAIIAVLVVAAAFAFSACQKQQEAPKPAEQSAVTSTMTSTMTTTAPEHK